MARLHALAEGAAGTREALLSALHLELWERRVPVRAVALRVEVEVEGAAAGSGALPSTAPPAAPAAAVPGHPPSGAATLARPGAAGGTRAGSWVPLVAGALVLLSCCILSLAAVTLRRSRRRLREALAVEDLARAAPVAVVAWGCAGSSASLSSASTSADCARQSSTRGTSGSSGSSGSSSSTAEGQDVELESWKSEEDRRQALPCEVPAPWPSSGFSTGSRPSTAPQRLQTRRHSAPPGAAPTAAGAPLQRPHTSGVDAGRGDRGSGRGPRLGGLPDQMPPVPHGASTGSPFAPGARPPSSSLPPRPQSAAASADARGRSQDARGCPRGPVATRQEPRRGGPPRAGERSDRGARRRP